jgi:lipid-binding SYLF domain-containing protein
MNRIRHWLVALSFILASAFGPLCETAAAATAAELNANGMAALERLYAQSDRARRYGRDARAILVFPKIVKAGFMIGGQGGEGVLLVRGTPTH